MAGSVAARRYAQAAFEIAEDRGEVDRWLGDLRMAADVLRESRVARFLANPGVPFEKKRQILATNLSDVNPLTQNLLFLLVKKGHLQSLPDITDEFENLVNQWRGTEVAEVTTAVPLDDQEAAAIKQRLEGLTGKKIVLRQSVDPAIIGGVIAKVGDKLIDGSVRGKLATLRQRLR